MNPELKKLTNLDFDQFGRVYAAKNAIESIRKKDQKFKILDIGGYKGNTAKLFPKDEVMVLDQYSVKDKNYIKANALNIPFGRNEYDIVLAFDVFEHILHKDREKFVSELTRVAKLLTIIAAPFRSKLTEEAESITNDYFKRISGKDHPWLIEHIDNKLPTSEAIENYLHKNKLKYQVVNNNNIEMWNYMQHFTLLSVIASMPAALAETNMYYNSHIDALEDSSREPYRKIYIIGDLLNKNFDQQKSERDLSVELELTDKIFIGIADHMIDQNNKIESQTKLIKNLQNEIHILSGSLSWKITKPLRALKNSLGSKKIK